MSADGNSYERGPAAASELRELLPATDDKTIVEHNASDDYGGDGGDGSGKNRFGQTLMAVWEALRTDRAQ